MRTPVSLVLRCCPPGPEPRKKSIRRFLSCGFIFLSRQNDDKPGSQRQKQRPSQSKARVVLLNYVKKIMSFYYHVKKGVCHEPFCTDDRRP